MLGYYFVHSPGDWSEDELRQIRADIETLGFSDDRRAAIGEGAGGAGFETVIELVILPVATGLISAWLWDLISKTKDREPSRKKLPKDLPERLDRYRLVVHVGDPDKQTIISIDLRQDARQTEIAVKQKLDEKLAKHPTRLDLREDDWDEF